ncbi:MAG TPA: hypothetical protein VHK69_07140, partial [Chitinophagaceae bacterium]|nr:hypothetical protein [Chitinophagaceae bacterium]
MSQSFQKRLYHYEAEPPARAWEGIVAGLENSGTAGLGERLHQYEQAPPAHVWEAVAASLEEETRTEAPVVPLFRRWRKPVRYAAVAASVLAFAFLVNLFFSKPAVSDETAALPATAPSGTVDAPAAQQDNPVREEASLTPPSPQGET